MAKTFWCEETENVQLAMRVYDTEKLCPTHEGYGYCQTMKTLGLDSQTYPPRTYLTVTNPDRISAGSWPSECEHCGSVFDSKASRQLWKNRVYRRTDTGETFVKSPSKQMPVGALWDAWYRGNRRGPDDIFLMCQTPGGEWGIDDRATNCTMPEDREHRCWCRHNNPKTEPVTVDKNGNTCAAGAGSIIIGDYHGFLQNGILT